MSTHSKRPALCSILPAQFFLPCRPTPSLLPSSSVTCALVVRRTDESLQKVRASGQCAPPDRAAAAAAPARLHLAPPLVDDVVHNGVQLRNRGAKLKVVERGHLRAGQRHVWKVWKVCGSEAGRGGSTM
eukprot:217864-Chlamydomonas_euryale.AAC.1